MGRLDVETRKYMSKPEVFADAFNYYLYGGKQIVKPEELQDVDSAELAVVYGSGARVPVQKFRDTLKRWTVKRDKNAVYMLLGAESQNYVNYAMAVRNMLYDALNYSGQVESARRSWRRGTKVRRRQILKRRMTSDEFLSGFRKSDRLLPVITLVVYFGTEMWDGPRSLHEMLAVQDKKLLSYLLAPKGREPRGFERFKGTPEGVPSYVADYKLNIITPTEFSEEAAKLLFTDFPLLMESIRNCGDKTRFAAMEKDGEDLREISCQGAEILRLATGFRIKQKEEEGETVKLAKGVKEFRDDCIEQGRAEGRAEGREEGREEGMRQGVLQSIRSLMNSMNLTASQAMDALTIPPEEQKTLMKLL